MSVCVCYFVVEKDNTCTFVKKQQYSRCYYKLAQYVCKIQTLAQ